MKAYLSHNGNTLTELQEQQFIRYYEMLIEKNKVMNLTAITEFDGVVLKHYMDSLSIGTVMDMDKITSMIDIGTGAGFPGIPIKIVYPHIKVTLMDSLNKRIKFLQEVINELELEGIDAIHSRAEDLAKREDYREQFDLCVSRAVANLSSLSEYCIPFLKKGGSFVSYKAGNSEDEINMAQKAIQILGGKIERTEEFFLPESDIARTLVVIEKVKETPKKYPRKAGLPTAEPITK